MPPPFKILTQWSRSEQRKVTRINFKNLMKALDDLYSEFSGPISSLNDKFLQSFNAVLFSPTFISDLVKMFLWMNWIFLIFTKSHFVLMSFHRKDGIQHYEPKMMRLNFSMLTVGEDEGESFKIWEITSSLYCWFLLFFHSFSFLPIWINPYIGRWKEKKSIPPKLWNFVLLRYPS